MQCVGWPVTPDAAFDEPSCRAGKWTVQQAAELSVAAPTMAAALDGRFMSGLKEERVAASKLYHETYNLENPTPVKVGAGRRCQLLLFLVHL